MIDTDATTGRWRDILSAMGIDRRFLVNRHGPCPMCEGKDRFRFDDKDGNGSWFCSHCGAGDGYKLLMAYRRDTFLNAAKEVEAIVGSCQATPPRVDTRDHHAAAMSLWSMGAPLTAETPAGLWMVRRIGCVPRCSDLRAIAAMRYAADGEEPRLLPGMLALVRDADGRPVNVHRTYLTRDGCKADVASPRKMMPGHVPPGSAIRLGTPRERLGVAEGIETALALARMIERPVWAAVNAGGLAKFTAPDSVTDFVSGGDNDPGFAGQAAAYECGRRNVRIGRSVQVMIPDDAGVDWRDVWMDGDA